MHAINCLYCTQVITRRSPQANNKKYCSTTCRNAHYRITNREHYNQWQRNRTGAYAPHKIQCLICGKWYRKPLFHAYQIHHIDAYTYKKTYQLDTGKGLIPEDTRERLRQYTKDHARTVVYQNLITKGKKTRYKKGDKTLGTYERTSSQRERLRLHATYRLPHKKNTKTS